MVSDDDMWVMLCDIDQYTDVDMLRLGRLERIHSDLHQFSDERLTQDISSADELDKFYASKVLCLYQYLVLFCFSNKTQVLFVEWRDETTEMIVKSVFQWLAGDGDVISTVYEAHNWLW